MTDVYLSTRTTDYLELRVISRSAEDVRLMIHGNVVSVTEYSRSSEELFFFKCPVSDLAPGREVEITLIQAGEKARVLRTRTLEQPAGRFICRFGILADLHISTRMINRPDSGKRLYSKSQVLAEKYIGRIEEQGAEFIIFPGDSLDPADSQNLDIFNRLNSLSGIPFYPVLGNHEPWGAGDAGAFNRYFCPHPRGYYSIEKGNARLLMLSTPDQDSLSYQNPQAGWLLSRLEQSQGINLLLFSHFSFLLHPCVRGYKNDGMQEFYNGSYWLREFSKHKSVKAVFAGHKNVPSIVKQDQVYHFLSPQLIQAPCAYDLVDLYENGLVRSVYEIDEQDWLWQSRQAFSSSGWLERFGRSDARNVTIEF